VEHNSNVGGEKSTEFRNSGVTFGENAFSQAGRDLLAVPARTSESTSPFTGKREIDLFVIGDTSL
jgi:hypothetical protein